MSPEGGIKLRVTAEQANVRERPDIVSAILQQFPEGATLEAERKEGEWYAVLVEKEGGGFVLGYVHESLVAIIEEAPPAPQREPFKPEEPAPAKPVEVKEEPRPAPSKPPSQPPPPSTVTGAREKYGVVLWIGGRRAEVGDLNDGAEGLARYYESQLSAIADAEVDAVHFGFLFGVELRVPVAPGLYLSFGAERTSAEASSTVNYTGGSSEATYFTQPAVKLTPISLAVLIYPVRFVYARAGLDFTLARCAYLYRLSAPVPSAQEESWQEWDGKANSFGFGYQIGFGVEWPIASFVSLVTELTYRYSRFDGFDGEELYRESTGAESRKEGALYRITARADGAETYTLVFIRGGDVSTEPGVISAQKAQLDLSGYSLKLGLSIRF
jgi:opacity protein-like surface antigen